MANQWFKFYGGEYLSDPKIERLSPLERSCWLTVLCMASMGDNGVIEFLTVESLLNRSGIQFDPYHPEEWESALSVLVKFKKLKMIDTNDGGQIVIINWAKRQEHNLTVAERVAKSRKNKSNVTIDVTNVTTEEKRIEENREEENTHTRKRDEESILIPEIIKALEEIDPKNKNYYGNKTQRSACNFLIKEYGLEEVLKRIKVLPKTNKLPYFPSISTPVQLRDKWVQLQDAVDRKRGEIQNIENKKVKIV